MNACVLIPIYEHGDFIGDVVARLEPVSLPCLIVDDGSSSATQEALRSVAGRFPFAEVIRRPRNGGKGAALKTGFRAAAARGFTHVVQLDADGQHDARDVPRFLEAITNNPNALVLGVPVFDSSVPRVRLYARQISRVSVWLACRSRCVPDPLCGFRALPLKPVLRILDEVSTGDRMDFEPELAVRLVWAGLPVTCVPTGITYRRGGLSHFSLLRDYPLLASLYARLITRMLVDHVRGRSLPAERVSWP